MTRKITTTMQITLDGLAERADGGTDWIGTNPDTFDWELFDRVDACVLGRAMYRGYEQYWRSINAAPERPLTATGAMPTADEIRYAEFANRTPHFVLTSSPDDLDWPVAQTIRDVDAVRQLRDQVGGDIYVVGGPTTVTGLLDAGLIDELRLTVHPVVLGSGTPLFARAVREHRLQLMSATPLKSGVVRLTYRRDASPTNETFQQAAERIYHDWDKALSDEDVEALLALYAPDVCFESPAAPLTMGTESGVCHGRDELRPVLEQVAARKPPLRTYYRTGYLTDGERTMIFEYPRDAPGGEQMDFVEVMEIADGLIQRHCVYWGWRGVKVIQDDAYHK